MAHDTAGYDSKYATLYYPWIKVADPLAGQAMIVPPSGHMAGVWARSDGARGVHKAPANEVVRGAISLALNLTKAEQSTQPQRDQLHPRVPGPGHPRLGRPHPLERPVVALPQRPPAVQLRRGVDLRGHAVGGLRAERRAALGPGPADVNAFLLRVWRDGALFGATPDQAFFVKCDEENNPPEDRDAGQLIVEIGIAPVKPAEFVIFRIGQFSGARGRLRVTRNH